MLRELTVEQFAVIERARLALGPGLNTVTGETGTGKSLLVEALSTVLGSRADREVVRAGVSTARVEAVFQGDWEALPPLRALLERHGLLSGEDEQLILSREVHRDGPSICRINGRAVTVGLLRDVGQHLVDIHGQGEHTALLSPGRQLGLLDAFAGLGDARARVAEEVRRTRRLQEAMEAQETGAEERERRRQTLAYQVEEVSRAELSPGEDEALRRERELLAHAQAIREACLRAHQALYGGAPSAVELLAEAQAALGASPDPEGRLAAQREALAAATAAAEEMARELRAYADTSEAQPQRLAQVEERLDLIARLRRKYGGTLEEVLEVTQRVAQELEQAEHAQEKAHQVREALEAARREAGAAAWGLSQARHQAAQRLEQAVAGELAELSMGSVRFSLALERRPRPGGLPAPDDQEYDATESGLDRVEFMVATNPGEGLRPLAKVASGGEVSRLMLALKSALQGNSGVPTLAFDEIDAGVGARAGEVVGRKLWAVSRHHQVVCVTHLPQIAAYADSHFRVDKSVLLERTFAQVEGLTDEERVKELAAMLGGTPSPKATASARELMGRARAHKGARPS